MVIIPPPRVSAAGVDRATPSCHLLPGSHAHEEQLACDATKATARATGRSDPICSSRISGPARLHAVCNNTQMRCRHEALSGWGDASSTWEALRANAPTVV